MAFRWETCFVPSGNRTFQKHLSSCQGFNPGLSPQAPAGHSVTGAKHIRSVRFAYMLRKCLKAWTRATAWAIAATKKVAPTRQSVTFRPETAARTGAPTKGAMTLIMLLIAFNEPSVIPW